MTKLKVMIGVNTLSKIKLLSAAWNVSIDAMVRFLLNHYLRFGVTGVTDKRFNQDISATTRGRSLLKSAAISMNERFELEDSEKDNLIKILQEANAEKDALINSQNSELVFLSNQLKTRDEMLNKISDIVDSKAIVPSNNENKNQPKWRPIWEYDVVWNRIVTKDENGDQVVVTNNIEHKIGRVIVEKVNEIIRLHNKEGGRSMKKEKLQAIRISIRHWMLDIRRPLKNGDEISFLDEDKVFVWDSSNKIVPCDGENCDLCKISNSFSCKGCPLTKNGMSCGNRNSPYDVFYNSPNLETATDMVHALVRTYWAVMEDKND